LRKPSDYRITQIYLHFFEEISQNMTKEIIMKIGLYILSALILVGSNGVLAETPAKAKAEKQVLKPTPEQLAAQRAKFMELRAKLKRDAKANASPEIIQADKEEIKKVAHTFENREKAMLAEGAPAKEERKELKKDTHKGHKETNQKSKAEQKN
jgi:hypothetical protein